MRLPTAVPAVLGASGIALAAPRPGTSPNILQRQDPLQDKDLYCQNWTRGTAEEAKETWGNLASSLIFANWLQDRGTSNPIPPEWAPKLTRPRL